ncbi:MAG TPA: sugar ABC transporter permease, partial [Clostridia bacterium]|nr:sugar ABC transporter permease [Clostridia bacterium]
VTFKFALFQVPIKLGFSLMVALILARNTRAVPAYRAAFYIPSLMGGSVAVALLWKQLFAYEGVINRVLGALGMPAQTKWLSDPSTALGVLVALGVWQFGSSMLIFLAAIKNIPQSYHEAAIVDGAGPVKRFFKITIPMLTPILFFNLINQTIGSFQAFNSSYLITQGKPLNTTLYYGVHLYNRAFTYYEMGYGSAMAWFMLLIIAALTAIIFRSSSAWVYYESEGK